MTRVVGIDPGTLSIDLCGIVDGRLYLDRSWPTAEALSEPPGLVEILTISGPPDLIVGPSGYGLPLRRAVEATRDRSPARIPGPAGRDRRHRRAERAPALRSVALEAYVEGATKAARQLRSSAPSADEVLLSGRYAADAEIRDRMETGLADIGPVRLLTGFATIAKQGAQGAALIADGLAGGANRVLVDRLRIREARGTVLDHLIFVSPATARLGIEAGD